MIITVTDLVIAGIAAFAAGLVNAIAGGGTLHSFPALVGIGVPEVAANVTNTVALCPGYFGASVAQRKDLTGQGRRLAWLVPAGVAGGIAGGLLLVYVNADTFRVLVPFLILFASFLLAVQERVRGWIVSRRERSPGAGDGTRDALIPTGFAAVYGGFFGAGVSIIVLSVLGLFISDTLARLNALKQCVAFSCNVAAAVYFLFTGLVIWPVAGVMAVTAVAGGAAGGKIAGKIDQERLRWIIVGVGVMLGLYFLARLVYP